MMSEQAPTAVTYKYTHIIKYKVISVPKDFGKTYENYKLQSSISKLTATKMVMKF